MIKKLTYSQTYTPSLGAFSSLKNGHANWFTCREMFHYHQVRRKVGRFIFQVKVNRYAEDYRQEENVKSQDNIIAFIKKVQDTIGLKGKDRLKIYKTNKTGILYIQLGKFWKEANIRRSLLTLLLRVGHTYNPKTNNFWTTLNRDYLRLTPKAVRRFMSGYTNCDLTTQWVESFTEKCAYGIYVPKKILENRLKSLKKPKNQSPTEIKL